MGIPLVGFLLNPPEIFKWLSVPFGIGFAWLMCSYQVPRWRQWALHHVEHLAELHQQAVASGLEWPYGSLFERTEIKPRALQFEETVLSLRYYVHALEPLLYVHADPMAAHAFTTYLSRILPLLEIRPQLPAALGRELAALDPFFALRSYPSSQSQTISVLFTVHAVRHFAHRLQRLVQTQPSSSPAG